MHGYSLVAKQYEKIIDKYLPLVIVLVDLLQTLSKTMSFRMILGSIFGLTCPLRGWQTTKCASFWVVEHLAAYLQTSIIHIMCLVHIVWFCIGTNNNTHSSRSAQTY